MQGFFAEQNQPIQIEGCFARDARQEKGSQTFADNVKVVQGDTTMTSKTLVVFYDLQLVYLTAGMNQEGREVGDADAVGYSLGPGGSSSIRRLP